MELTKKKLKSPVGDLWIQITVKQLNVSHIFNAQISKSFSLIY